MNCLTAHRFDRQNPRIERLPESDGSDEAEMPMKQDVFLKRGIAEPHDRPGGPPVEPDVFTPFFEGTLSREDMIHVVGLLREYRAWREAFVAWLEDVAKTLDFSE